MTRETVESSSLARAHEPAPRTRAEIDAIVESVALQMVTGKWRRGRSMRELADQHGVSLSTAKYWTRLASQRAWANDDDEVQEAKVAHVGQLDAIATEAHEAGDYEAATRAIRTVHEILGTIRQGPAVNILVDPRTGAPRPEVVRVLEASDERLLGAVRRVVEAMGVDVAEFESRLAEALEAPPALGGG